MSGGSTAELPGAEAAPCLPTSCLPASLAEVGLAGWKGLPQPREGVSSEPPAGPGRRPVHSPLAVAMPCS